MIPQQYQWLTKEHLPPLLERGLSLFGVAEKAGPANNPVIMEWSKKTGQGVYYTADSVPWCGLYMAECARLAGMKFPAIAVRAKEWATFGENATVAKLGYVLVFSREGGGHVGMYVGEDKDAYHVLGGNQGDKVCISRIAKNRCTAIRKPLGADLPNVRVVKLAASGGLSQNEA